MNSQYCSKERSENWEETECGVSHSGVKYALRQDSVRVLTASLALWPVDKKIRVDVIPDRLFLS